VRLFVAAWPTDTVVRLLGELRTSLEESGLRWVRPEHWHVTLAFLGSVPDQELDALTAALGAAAASEHPVTAVLGPATTALGRGVLCVPVDGLDALAITVGAASAPFGRAEDGETGPFTGHLTLARARRGRVPAHLLGSPANASWRVEELALVSSVTGREGPRYTTEARFTLGG